MKKKILNCLATTGLSILLLSIAATAYNASFLCVDTVFQIFLANIIIHGGLMFGKGLECTYFYIEILAEIGYVLLVLILLGCLFDWYSSTPLWLLILMGTLVYLAGCLISIFHVREDVDYINNQLKKR